MDFGIPFYMHSVKNPAGFHKKLSPLIRAIGLLKEASSTYKNRYNVSTDNKPKI